jgi:protein-S-isoprenylcysteine O-methyltransferase Ste14
VLIGPDRGWIAGQLALLACASIVPLLEWRARRRRRGRVRAATTTLAALATIGIGGAIVGRAARDLSDSVTMSPTPIDGGRLVETGIYGQVRHPMYLSVLLVVAGWTLLWTSWMGLWLLGAAVISFSAKLRYEEQLLRQSYPGYDAYARRVPARLIPGLY